MVGVVMFTSPPCLVVANLFNKCVENPPSCRFTVRADKLKVGKLNIRVIDATSQVITFQENVIEGSHAICLWVNVLTVFHTL